jgi:hypothetical protein
MQELFCGRNIRIFWRELSTIYDVKTSLSKKKLDKEGYMLLIENALRPRGRDAARPAIFEEYEN